MTEFRKTVLALRLSSWIAANVMELYSQIKAVNVYNNAALNADLVRALEYESKPKLKLSRSAEPRSRRREQWLAGGGH